MKAKAKTYSRTCYHCKGFYDYNSHGIDIVYRGRIRRFCSRTHAINFCVERFTLLIDKQTSGYTHTAVEVDKGE